MTWLLLRLLPYALRFVEGKQYRYALHAAVAALADIVVAHTTFAAIAGRPQRNEWTVSQMLERLAHPFNSLDVNYHLYRQIALYINRASPTGDHIKAVR